MSIDGFLYSKSTTKLSKINNFLRTRQYPTSSNSLTKSACLKPACLKPGEERQPHAGGGPLSRDSQDRGFARFVNKKSPDFFASSNHKSIRMCTNGCSLQCRSAAPTSKCASIGACHGVALRRRIHLWLRFLNHISYIERGRTVSINLFHHTALDRTNLLRRPPRAHIIFSDVEHDVVNKLERMSQH